VEREWIAKGTKRVRFLWEPLGTRITYISRVGSRSSVIDLWRRAVEVHWSVFTDLAIAKLLNFGEKCWLRKCFTENIEAIWTSSLKIRAKIEICLSKGRFSLVFYRQKLAFFPWNLIWNSSYTVVYTIGVCVRCWVTTVGSKITGVCMGPHRHPKLTSKNRCCKTEMLLGFVWRLQGAFFRDQKYL